MNEQMKAGSDIHAGGGYSIGTQEDLDKFVKVRNQSLGQRRIKELAEQAVEETQRLMIMEYRNFESKLYERFAELVIKECAASVIDFHQNGRNASTVVKEHFGVE